MDYSKMTVKALRALLVERDCEAPAKANKSELVSLLESLDDSEPAVIEAALEELPSEPKALWATVDDRVSAFVEALSLRSELDESEVVRGMLYCAYATMSRRGEARSAATIKGALRDTTFRRQWL